MRWLEVSFSGGRPVAAYLYLHDFPIDPGEDVSTREIGAELIGDFLADGTLWGIEILAFDDRHLEQIDNALLANKQLVLDQTVLRPLVLTRGF